MKLLLAWLGKTRLVLLGVCAFLGLLAFFLKFCVPGYSFSALLCLMLIGIILFYTFVPLLGPRLPGVTKWAMWIVTAILILGVLVVAGTEAAIFRASLGSADREADFVVVLGAKVNRDGPSVSLWDRICAAYEYLETHPDTVAILSGGQGTDEPITEAECMYRELVALGIDPRQLRREEAATSTWENIQFSLDLIEAETGVRPDSLGIVSSEYHLLRASMLAKKCGITDFIGIPAKTSRLSQAINHFLREAAGVWHYILLGGQYD